MDADGFGGQPLFNAAVQRSQLWSILQNSMNKNLPSLPACPCIVVVAFGSCSALCSFGFSAAAGAKSFGAVANCHYGDILRRVKAQATQTQPLIDKPIDKFKHAFGIRHAANRQRRVSTTPTLEVTLHKGVAGDMSERPLFASRSTIPPVLILP
jgi:hypothetical protein